MDAQPNDPKPVSRWVRLRHRLESLLTERGLSEEIVSHPVHAFIHFWGLVIRSFVRNRCPVRATALAYTTLLALVPLLAVGLGVSSTLLKGDEQQTQQFIEQVINQMAPQLEQLPGTEEEKREAREQIIEEILSFIANIHSGALGMTGMLALVFIAIGLLSTIEFTFNDIWGVSRGRSWFARVICYWTAITLGPLIILLAMGLAVSGQLIPARHQPATVEIQTPAPALTTETGQSGESTRTEAVHTDVAPGTDPPEPPRLVRMVRDGPLGRFLFRVLPFLILIGSFALLYQLMPNTQVSWRAAAVGGLVGALLWVLNSQFNVAFAARVVAASKIYGPLGVFPVFLIGLYMSWLIVLFGAQVAYAVQNRRAYLQDKLAEGINQRGREFVALRVMLSIARRFQNGSLPPSITELSADLGVSARIIGQVLEPMRQINLVVEVNAPGLAYAPARPLDQISAQEILQALRSGQGQEPATEAGPDRDIVREVCGTVREAERGAARPLTLQRLLEHSSAPQPGG
jgi:membrane protein